MNIIKSVSLVLGHIFKDNERMYAYQYNIAITWPKYKYIGAVIQVSATCFMRKICLIIEWRLTENRPVLEEG